MPAIHIMADHTYLTPIHLTDHITVNLAGRVNHHLLFHTHHCLDKSGYKAEVMRHEHHSHPLIEMDQQLIKGLFHVDIEVGGWLIEQ